MPNSFKYFPDSTAERVALWRALHLEVDSAPAVLNDDLGLKLIAPADGWKNRPDMHPMGTRGYRAAIIARARYLDDLIFEKFNQGIKQYVILGAGLDTFSLRNHSKFPGLKVFEIDQLETQNWKKNRINELNLPLSEDCAFVDVDFESNENWTEKLKKSGFDSKKPALISSTGVAMYLTKEANQAVYNQIAGLAKGTTFFLTFMLPIELTDQMDQEGYARVQESAKKSGTPFLSFYAPIEILNEFNSIGYSTVKHISREEVTTKYFLNRVDGLAPSSGEEYLIAIV